jgi:hypothetical protein
MPEYPRFLKKGPIEAPRPAPAPAAPAPAPVEFDQTPIEPPSTPAAPLPPALVQVELWRARFSRLDPLDPPRGCRGFFPSDAWRHVYREVMRFLDLNASPCWGRIAVECGWDEIGLFGVHPVVGIARLDCAGALLVNLRGERTTQVLRNLIRFHSGVAVYRVPAHPAAIPVWDFKGPAP